MRFGSVVIDGGSRVVLERPYEDIGDMDCIEGGGVEREPGW